MPPSESVRSNAEIVRVALFPERFDLVRLFVEGDPAAAIDLSVMHPELEVHFAQPAGPGTDFRGLAGLVEGWRDWLAAWASYEVVVEDVLEAPDNRVLMLARLSGHTKHDGVRIEQPAAAVATLADGLVTRIEFHLDRREAAEAAGLPSPAGPPLK